MADKRSNEEARQEVLKDDAKRDVNINLGIFVASAAIMSSLAATLAVLSIMFLNKFRADVDNLWLSCVPLCFSFVTGLAVAYRKQMADVGVHIALAVTTLLAGGAGYGLSVEQVYFNRENCTAPEDSIEDCNREVLTTIYFIAGAVASGFAVLGFLGSLCACSNAMSRRAQREKYKLMRLEYEENRRRGEIRDQKRRLGQPNLPPPPPPTSNGSFEKPTGPPPTMNGVNGLNGTSKAPLQIINEQTEPPQVPVTKLPDPPKEENEMTVTQSEEPKVAQLEEPEEAKVAETEAKKEEVVKEIKTTTIIVRDYHHDRRKQPAGVDRGTQVEPLDTVIVPTKRDVGVSPCQEEDVETKTDQTAPHSADGDVLRSQSSGDNKGENSDGGDGKAKVMTHL